MMSPFIPMIVEDDIVSYIDDSDRKITNAGKTTHRGVELGLTTSLSEEWRIKKAWSFYRSNVQ